MLRNIFLYGKLKEFGEVWELDVESIAEAAHAININTGGEFGKVIKNMRLDLVRGKDLLGGESLNEDLINLHYGTGDFHISPTVQGAGGIGALGWVLIASIVVGAVMAFTMSGSVRPEDNFESEERGYSFGSVGNTDRQGSPIPLIYGEVYTGSIVVSQGVRTEEVVS